MTTPQPEQPDGMIQATVGLAETPFGQKVALTLVILLGKDNALGIAEAVTKTAEQMSGTGLIVAPGNGMPVKGQG